MKVVLHPEDWLIFPAKMFWKNRGSGGVHKGTVYVISAGWLTSFLSLTTEAHESFCGQSEKTKVVVYTRRAQMVRYDSCFRQRCIQLRYKKEWHKQGQTFLPPSVKCAGDILAEYSGEPLSECFDVFIPQCKRVRVSMLSCDITDGRL